MAPLRTTDVFDEASQLFAQGDQHLIFVLDRFCCVVNSLKRYNRASGRAICCRPSARRPNLDRLTIEERNQFFARALGTEGKGDRGQSMYGVQAEQDVVMLAEKYQSQRREMLLAR
jgi:hypothetical protein